MDLLPTFPPHGPIRAHTSAGGIDGPDILHVMAGAEHPDHEFLFGALEKQRAVFVKAIGS